MRESATLTRPISPRPTAFIDVCPTTAVVRWGAANLGGPPAEIEIEDELGEEVASVPRLRDPGEPTQQEWDDHDRSQKKLPGDLARDYL